jgi:RimJ/RimL family protein N-acetyltransferase
MAFLYALATERWEHWWRIAGMGKPCPASLASRLAHDCAAIYIVESHGRSCGEASLYEHNSQSQTVWIDAVMASSARDVRAEVVRQIVDRAFNELRARKVYALHAGYETPLFSELHCHWHREGCFRERVLCDGRYWDQHVCAVYGREWRGA